MDAPPPQTEGSMGAVGPSRSSASGGRAAGLRGGGEDDREKSMRLAGLSARVAARDPLDEFASRLAGRVSAPVPLTAGARGGCVAPAGASARAASCSVALAAAAALGSLAGEAIAWTRRGDEATILARPATEASVVRARQAATGLPGRAVERGSWDGGELTAPAERGCETAPYPGGERRRFADDEGRAAHAEVTAARLGLAGDGLAGDRLAGDGLAGGDLAGDFLAGACLARPRLAGDGLAGDGRSVRGGGKMGAPPSTDGLPLTAGRSASRTGLRRSSASTCRRARSSMAPTSSRRRSSWLCSRRSRRANVCCAACPGVGGPRGAWRNVRLAGAAESRTVSSLGTPSPGELGLSGPS